MKNLLRMSLFIIARAGLSLAVVAWIVGQWSGVSLVGPLDNGLVGAELLPGSGRCRRIESQLPMQIGNVVRTPWSGFKTVLVHEKFLFWVKLP
ncbi:MAG: hypothetical protein GY878_05150 [Fuerstiella sp.]|nr:hypothetical protein [Fuerstiella sp.]